jgi:predicted ester cyclase
MSNSEQNLETAKRFMNDGIGPADLSVFDETLNPNITVETGLSPAGPIEGLENYKDIFAGFADAFPVRKFVIDEIFGVDDKVVVRFTATAVFKKDYYGVPATNQVIDMKEVHVLTFKDGKIISNIVSGTNFPFEYIMYPVLKDLVIGNLLIEQN